MNKKHMDFGLDIKSFDLDTGYFEGYGNVANFTDYAGDNTQKGAFTKTLQRHKENKTMPALLWQHKMDQPIGVYKEMYEDENGLYVKGELNLDTQAGREAYSLLKQGAIKGLSIGYIPVKERANRDKGYNELLEVELLEVSLVTIPCNSKSNVEYVKSLFENEELPSERELEKALRELGLSRKQSKSFISSGYKSLLEQSEPETEEKELPVEESVESEKSEEINTDENEIKDEEKSEEQALLEQKAADLLLKVKSLTSK